MSANQFETVMPHGGRTVRFHEERVVDGTVREAVADVNRYFSRQRLEKAATQDERERLARELHDGVLQSLTGATLQLDAIGRLIVTNPAAAHARLAAVADSLAEQQRELRQWIARLRVAEQPGRIPAAELTASLQKLRDRAAWQHGIEIDLCVTGETVPRALGDHIYRLVQEGFTNIGRHARARMAGVHAHLAFDRVTLVICDDGIGFPYRGRFMLHDLVKRGIGPVSMRERIASLGGELMLTTTASGTRVDIALPIRPA